MQSTLIIYSSAAKDGNTGRLVKTLRRQLAADTLYLDEYEIHPYSYEHKHKHDDFRPLLERALGYEHLVFASPVYWSAMTSTMKAFFDRITEYMDNEALRERLRRLREKRVSLYSTSAGEKAPRAFVGSFTDTFSHLGLTLAGRAHLDCSDGFDEVRAERLLGKRPHVSKRLFNAVMMKK